MPREKLSVIRETREEQRLRLCRARAIEKILLDEFEAAQAEFDEVVRSHIRGRVTAAVERYTRAVTRMRTFLAQGEIPPDIAQKIEDPRDDAGLFSPAP